MKTLNTGTKTVTGWFTRTQTQGRSKTTRTAAASVFLMFRYATRTWPEDAALYALLGSSPAEVSSFDYCVPTAFKGSDFDRIIYKKLPMMHSMLQRIHMCKSDRSFSMLFCVVRLTGEYDTISVCEDLSLLL